MMTTRTHCHQGIRRQIWKVSLFIDTDQLNFIFINVRLITYRFSRVWLVLRAVFGTVTLLSDVNKYE